MSRRQVMHGEKSKLEQHMDIKHACLNPLSPVKPLHEHTQTDAYGNTYASLMLTLKQKPCSAVLQRTMQLWMSRHLFAVGLLLRLHCTEEFKLPQYDRSKQISSSEGHLLYKI